MTSFAEYTSNSKIQISITLFLVYHDKEIYDDNLEK